MSDKWIAEQCQGDNPILVPFHPGSVSALPDGKKITSLGSSSYGYDLSLGTKFKLLKPAATVQIRATNKAPLMIDPCNFNQDLFQDIDTTHKYGGVFILPPMSFALGVTVERIRMPRGFTGICMEKSTCARSALTVTVTPIESEWEGWLTLELYNKTDYPMILTPGMGITQLLFIEGNQDCAVSYKDRGGKYQNQPNSPVAATVHRS